MCRSTYYIPFQRILNDCISNNEILKKWKKPKISYMTVNMNKLYRTGTNYRDGAVTNHCIFS